MYGAVVCVINMGFLNWAFSPVDDPDFVAALAHILILLRKP